MPRDGSGHSHNAVEAGQNLVHGNEGGDAPASSGVDRSNKAAPAPELEKGNAMEGMNASGGGDKATGSGHGPIEPTVEKEAKKQ